MAATRDPARWWNRTAISAICSSINDRRSSTTSTWANRPSSGSIAVRSSGNVIPS